MVVWCSPAFIEIQSLSATDLFQGFNIRAYPHNSARVGIWSEGLILLGRTDQNFWTTTRKSIPSFCLNISTSNEMSERGQHATEEKSPNLLKQSVLFYTITVINTDKSSLIHSHHFWKLYQMAPFKEHAAKCWPESTYQSYPTKVRLKTGAHYFPGKIRQL